MQNGRDLLPPQNERRLYEAPSLATYGSVGVLTQGSASKHSDGANSKKDQGNVQQSAKALKHNICRIGTHPSGIGLYLFDYRPEYAQYRYSNGRHLGVMADEVEQVMPEAVGLNAQGHKTVDYARLGIRFPEFP